MPVILPNQDPNPEARAEERAEARATYRYTWHRPQGVASAAEVPKSDGFATGALVRFGGVQARLKAHQAANSAGNKLDNLKSALADESSGGWIKRWVSAIEQVEEGDHRATPEVALRYFGKDVPPFMAQLTQHPEQSDRLFAWQRLGGANPMALRGIDALPAGFSVSQAHFDAAMGVAGVTDDSLEGAREEGRLFVADWRFLEGARTGATETGLEKHVFPCTALFVTSPEGAFLPVAIQCGDGAPVFTPADGVAWTMSKLVAQTADTHEQALIWHLAHCHFLMEAFTLATNRQLANAHPIKRLLSHHNQFTLAINTQVRDTLMKEGDDLEILLATTRGTSVAAVGRAMREFDYARVLPPANVAARGLGDVKTLPHCPYRDDGLDVWAALQTFVGDYVALYYADDAAVAGDREVREWTDDLRGHWGGRLSSIPTLSTRAQLVDLVAFMIWTAGPFHTICNYSQYEYMSYSPNMPTMLLGHAPHAGSEQADLHDLYLTEELSMSQYGFFYEQTQLTENHLGEYPPGTFDDPRVGPLIIAFGEALRAVDERIDERNAERPAAYEWLRPKNTTASIHS